MALHRELLNEINSLTLFLVEEGLADDQNFPFETQTGDGAFSIQYPNASFAPMLKDRPYPELYQSLVAGRSYNAKMLDGALLQISLDVGNERLVRSRLAFLPSPDLLEFQNEPELYMEELLYADVVDRRVVTVPVRFEYDGREGVAIPLDHPEPHVTLGQYHGCRIPATCAITPLLFVDFVLRSFYNLATSTVTSRLPKGSLRFPSCVAASELDVVHVGIPAVR